MEKTPKMEVLLESVIQEQRKMGESLGEMKVTLAVNTASLQHHMRRTELLESHVNGMPARILIFISISSGLLGLFQLLH